MRRIFYLGFILFLAGCATPIGVNKIGLRDAYHDSQSNALSGEMLSFDTKLVLHRFDLDGKFHSDPDRVIKLIHERLQNDDRRDLRFALAELSYYVGAQLRYAVRKSERNRAPDYFLMSAYYAYRFLFDTSAEAPPEAFDNRFRVACDLFNKGLGKALSTGESGRLIFPEGVRQFPVGALTISLDTKTLPWPLENFESFFSADDFAVRGLSVRNRTPGLGLPVIALLKKNPETRRQPSIALTVFLRLEGTAKAVLEFHTSYDEIEISVQGRKVPLETDSTTPLAYHLEDPNIWNAGIKRFFKVEKQKPELIQLQPYRPGRIPVVFVHGTASSPVWWAEMWNTLRSNSTLRHRFQFWFFMYNSSAPMAVSAAALRDQLTETIAKLDPEHRDPALRKAVMIGHSQGGLLTKMSVVHTGDALWNSIMDKGIEELEAEPEVKKQLGHYLFFEPLPFVTRAIFISTPHRGSYRAKSWVRNLMRRLISFPSDVITGNPKVWGDLIQQSKMPPEFRKGVPTSIDSMSPTNPTLLALAELPIAPGIVGHSIIPVLGDGELMTENDGVVEYKSAHLDGVESEFVVKHTGHSCQDKPATIEEVRRILLKHLNEVPKT